MTTATPLHANGHAALTLPVQGLVSGWPPRDNPGQDGTPDKTGRRRTDGDAVIRSLAAAVVLAVAAFAAIVSYAHIFELGRLHGQDGTAARLLPLSVDGLIAAASLVMLHAARRKLDVPGLARAMLALGVLATVAANIFYGLPFGWLSAVVSAWPAVAFVGSVEMAVRFVRDARQDTTETSPPLFVAADDAGATPRTENIPVGDTRDSDATPDATASDTRDSGDDRLSVAAEAARDHITPDAVRKRRARARAKTPLA